MSKTELVWVVIEHEGKLAALSIPQDRKALALQLLQSVFDDGVMQAVELPPEWKKVPLKEALKP